MRDGRGVCRSALTSNKHPHRNHQQLLETHPEDVMPPRSVHSQLGKNLQSGKTKRKANGISLSRPLLGMAVRYWIAPPQCNVSSHACTTLWPEKLNPAGQAGEATVRQRESTAGGAVPDVCRCTVSRRATQRLRTIINNPISAWRLSGCNGCHRLPSRSRGASHANDREPRPVTGA
jgi:hypothetical protein